MVTLAVIVVVYSMSNSSSSCDSCRMAADWLQTRVHLLLLVFFQGSTIRKRKMYEEFLSKVSILGQLHLFVLCCAALFVWVNFNKVYFA